MTQARFAYHDIIFDCDSTLSVIEGIDELAALKGKGMEIAALTHAAMDGKVALEDVYQKRLDLIQPTRADLARIVEQYKATLVPGAREVVMTLQAAGCVVHVVSGGILQAVQPFARWLGIAEERVHAVQLRFDAQGHYAGFFPSPLSTSQGKIEVLRALRAPGRRAMLIGDGSSDLAAAGEVDLFVGFGGVIARTRVLAGAGAHILENSLLPVLKLAQI